MPIYVYKCDSCGLKIEKLLPMRMYATKFTCSCGKMLKKDYKAMKSHIRCEANDSVDYDLTGKPIVYHTKGQLRKIAKQHGCRIKDDLV